MEELNKLLEENPKAKEEFDTIIEVLNLGTIGEIKRLLNYIEVLEDMIEANEDRSELLHTIDEHNCWTQWMRADGLLRKDETWWENVLEGTM